jgi:xanthosine utilization system XapX-like protein
MKKLLLFLAAALFAVFAYFNLNDPDPLPWIMAYLGTATLFVMRALDLYVRRIVAAVGIVLLIWMCTMLPAIIDWLGAGTPSIVEEMKATDPHIEAVREFLGLLIAVVALAALYFTAPRTMALDEA